MYNDLKYFGFISVVSIAMCPFMLERREVILVVRIYCLDSHCNVCCFPNEEFPIECQSIFHLFYVVLTHRADDTNIHVFVCF